jgi:DNA polymerase III sliding clamp (beta) subunit (PCNA family)
MPFGNISSEMFTENDINIIKDCVFYQQSLLIHGEKIDTEVKSLFSLEKIREMLKADKFSDIAIIKLGDDMPLNLKLRMVSEDGELSFLLAPRIETDD